MKIVHVKKHSNNNIAEVGEGLLRYPKDGYTSFKNYQVPSDFSVTDGGCVALVVNIFYEGLAVSECGTVKLYVDEKSKSHYKKL